MPGFQNKAINCSFWENRHLTVVMSDNDHTHQPKQGRSDDENPGAGAGVGGVVGAGRGAGRPPGSSISIQETLVQIQAQLMLQTTKICRKQET